ncbi:MAG: DUF1576 domain-containing protein [Oscillibacter sp.]|nr:DUF1576 domain-containing protein [Oscillibacter sp.]
MWGLYHIVTMQDLLITDYVSIGGPGAALINAGIVTIISICIIKISGDPFNGFTIVEMGLMAGFSLFGKNFINIWPIIFGTWLYAHYRKEPFSKHASVALLSTSLAPLVSYMALGSIHASIWLGAATGICIGFILPSLSSYTYKIQNGMNLYNMGFACGLFAMMIVPVLSAFGDSPDSVLYWATGYNLRFFFVLSLLCVTLIILGLFATGQPVWAVWAGYRRLLSTTGRAPSDYLRMFGAGPVLLNMGVNGLIGTGYVLVVGGDLNGPTMGGIFTIMGFSAFGKHIFNITPVMLGVFAGAYGMHHTPDYPSLQLAGLFGTCLAPISGYFGWPFGVLAGFIHSCLVLQTGGPVAGLNLYNNGFSGGLIAIVLYPTITAIWRKGRLTLQDKDYYDLFEESEPIDVSSWRTSKSIAMQEKKKAEEEARNDAQPPED